MFSILNSTTDFFVVKRAFPPAQNRRQLRRQTFAALLPQFLRHAVECLSDAAGEGGPYGMALLAAYRLHRADGETLAGFLNRCVFADARSTALSPDPVEQAGFAEFLKQYQTALQAERAVIE